METKLPRLFKKTSTGAIQQWDISVEDTTIVTTYGQVGGKMQTTRDVVKTGKNQGRKNATEADEQAMKEANNKWLKQKKSGYVESIKAAESGETDDIIEGGIIPMLAKNYEDYATKIVAEEEFAMQPKLDGARMICVIEDGEVSLWTRTRKRITSCVHIEQQMKKVAAKMKLKNAILDGEAYNHDLKNDFEALMSAFRKDKPTPEALELQYHVYDQVSDKCFKTRIGELSNLILFGGELIQLVDTQFSTNLADVLYTHNEFVGKGYEGVMIRALGRPYENKRSSQLLKLKTFIDSEFEIIDLEEGRGKLAGHCGAFVCKTADGKNKFNVKMSGDTAILATYWQNKEDYVGRLLTVKYQSMTKEQIPRFPVGLRIRDDL